MKKKNLYSFVVLAFLLQPLATLGLQEPYTVYFAGELFDHKHLTGNAMLAKALEFLYKGRYQCILPQDIEERLSDPVEIRNHDIVKLIRADLAIFNFDGTELDSGTVVEFMIAKMLDIPAVILRTDFRSCGDADTVHWNLMAFGYPRTEILNHSCWDSYRNGIEQMHQGIAHKIHQAFETVINMPTVFIDEEEILHAHTTMTKLCGSGLSKHLPHHELIRLVHNKINKNLYKFAEAI